MFMLCLMEPTATSNWILAARGLDDPAEWTRFLPAAADTERHRFELAAQRYDASVRLSPCKHMIRAGVAALEYDWNLSEDLILEHALGVAEALGQELALAGPLAA